MSWMKVLVGSSPTPGTRKIFLWTYGESNPEPIHAMDV